MVEDLIYISQMTNVRVDILTGAAKICSIIIEDKDKTESSTTTYLSEIFEFSAAKKCLTE